MPLSNDDFQRQARQQRPSFLLELGVFLVENKKWWLLPIVVCLLLLAAVVFLAGTGAAPFIYTLF